MENNPEYYPCVTDRNGRVLKKVGDLMSRENARKFLKQFYNYKWLMAEAMPQHMNTVGLHD